MQEEIQQILTNYPLIAPLVFVLFRAITIVIPPAIGGVVDTAGIIVFGWKRAFIYAEIGIMLGAMTAFAIARKFREPVVRRFAPLQKIGEWEKRLSDLESFWAWVAIRLPTNLAFDYISYAAGLSNCSFRTFFLSTLIGNIPSMLVFYYLGGISLSYGIIFGISVIVAVSIIGFLVYRHMDRSE